MKLGLGVGREFEMVEMEFEKKEVAAAAIVEGNGGGI